MVVLVVVVVVLVGLVESMSEFDYQNNAGLNGFHLKKQLHSLNEDNAEHQTGFPYYQFFLYYIGRCLPA